MQVTRDMLSTEESDEGKYKVVLWSSDGVPCTLDDGLTIDEAEGLRVAAKAALETWT
jgi:hypothetical protein